MNQRCSDAHDKLCKAIKSGNEAEISKAKDHYDSVTEEVQNKLFPEIIRNKQKSTSNNKRVSKK